MTPWRVGRGGDRVLFHDEATDLRVLVFVRDDKILAEISLSRLVGDERFSMVLGPFAHLAAVCDAVTGFLIRLEADEEDGVISVVRAGDETLPESPPVPAARLFSAEMMSPFLAADLMWEAQQLLDTGLDPAAGVAALESAYPSERYDRQDLAAYREQCGLDLLDLAQRTADQVRSSGPAAVTATISPPSAPAAPQVATAPLPAPAVAAPETPIRLKPIATQPLLAPIGVRAVPSVGTGQVTNMPRAAIPRTQPFVRVDWSGLSVIVIEEQLTRELSRLRAQWRGRASSATQA